jgi:phosphoglycerol transferase MdoB-like AlkP superfamily enzyme
VQRPAHSTAHSVAVDRLIFLVCYLLYWTAMFIVARAIFLAYEHHATAQLGIGTAFFVFAHGVRMDLSAAAYATIVPALFVVMGRVVPPRLVRGAIATYTYALIIVVALFTAGDLGIYDAWGVRLDATPLVYLRTPVEAFASVESGPVLLCATVALVFALVCALAYRRYVATRLDGERYQTTAGSILALVAGLLLLIPIRGGLQWTPLNQSSVYFSSNEFANQAALNVPWNVAHSVATENALGRTNPYTQIDAAGAQRMVDSLLADSGATPTGLLRVKRPNVILIIWESLTAKVVAPLGGVAGVTPHLDSLVHDGIFFDHFYASGDRSAKGLVAILSGFPPLPHVQVMNTPARAARLPMLSRDLDSAGYATSFYYGGELAFANIKSYLLDGRFDHLVGESEFPRDERNSKWGAHDQYVLGRLLRDVPGMRRPFFSALFTLSSHEPFEVPMAPVFTGRDESSRFLNSHVYADRSVGAFIRAARAQPWWDSTLVVIVADHGHPLPRIQLPNGTEADARQRIPMLWLGGALARRDTVISRFGAQTDLAPTLLAQLGLPHAQYRWGHDLLTPDGASFAYYSFLDGFGFVDARGSLVYDALARRVTQRSGNAGEPEQRAGLALLRLSFQDYLDKR